MKSSTRLECVVFQLTPTRTRCDLVIVANGKTEKIASGLINPFLAHLKSARDQFAKGGYSIVLKPESSTDPGSWFTKDTVERFVRFVSTPVILERVYILECEILQIEKAIAIHGQNDTDSSKVGNVHSVAAESIQGSVEKDKGRKRIPNVNEEKAIVLYEPSTLANEETTAYHSEENSKVQLVKVLETRKSFLQNEQKMAFARALASGFDIDHMAPLISFAECFVASRLINACTRFVDLWKTKHDIGQWLETEGADAASNNFDYATMAASEIMLSSVVGKEMNLAETWPESAIEPGQFDNLTRNTEEFTGRQAPMGYHNHVHGQFSHPMYPPWGMHSPPGLPVFQAYPIQGMPYYQSYPGHGPFIYPPYQTPENAGSPEKMIQKSHSPQTNGISEESENLEKDDAERKSQYDSDLEKEASGGKGLHRKTRSSKKNSGTVVIRNINYVTAKRQNVSGSRSPSNTDDESDKDAEDTSGTKSTTSHWHAFQNCLLRSAEESSGADIAMFSTEMEANIKQRSTALGKDPLADNAQYQSAHGGAAAYLNTSGDTRSIRKTSNDELLRTNIGNYGDQGRHKDGSVDIQAAERNGSVLRYRTGNDDFMIHRQQIQPNYAISADLFSVNTSTDGTRNVTDDSFILPTRPTAPHEDGTAKRDAMDMNYELPSSLSNTENCKIKNQDSYEPEDLGWIGERGTEKELNVYNPVLDYEMEVHMNKGALGNSRNKDTMSNTKMGSNKKDNNQKPKVASGTSDSSRSLGPVKRGKPSKMSPIEEARSRAEKLRSYKVDLQNQKKEKEEEQKKRIEALKLERQKRIIARSNVAPTKSVLPSPQTRKQLLMKASPGSLKGSKFSDLEPGFSSPLQGVSRRTLSLGAINGRKAPKPKSNDANPLSVNKVSMSMSSLSELKTGESIVTPEPKPTMTRIRRLSEPRKGTNNVSSAKRLNGALVAKTDTSTGPEIKKPDTSTGPESKKVSDMMNLDKTKAATLPELKMRVSDEKSMVKQVANNGSLPIPTHTPANAEVETSKVVVQQNDGDEKSGAVKNAASLEYEKPSVADEPTDKKLTESLNQHSEQAPTNINNEPRANQLKVRFDAYEVKKSATEKNLSKSPVGETGKPYQAPYARVSSLEEPCTRNSEYVKAPPTTSNTETSFGAEATEVSVVKVVQRNFERVSDVLEKPCVKEPSKGGFKRLLKFGKKNLSSSSDLSADIDILVLTSSERHHNAANGASSSQAPTLKNLISHEEANMASTPPPKSSRHFSLLSPFRKSAEKKIIIL
ncbi:unnamed protein product [Rhodiola kirilowii]